MSTQRDPLFTIEDLELMPEDGNRYEVTEGELFVSKSPTRSHQDISLNLFYEFETFLHRQPVGRIWPTPGVIFSKFRNLYAKYGVTEYWLVDLGKRRVEAYVLREKTLVLHGTFSEAETIPFSVVPGFKCKVEASFSS